MPIGYNSITFDYNFERGDKMLETYILEQLAAFAEYGTLSKAAEKLHISQPALSRSMKKIEDELGITLFVRNKSKIELNETGLVAAECAKNLIAQNKAMIERIISFDRSLHSIVLGSCTTYPITALMPILQQHFGGMSITSEMAYTETLVNGLKDGRYDIIVLNEPCEDEEIFCQRFIDERIDLAAPQNHPLAQKSEVSFADMAGENILLLANIGFWFDVCKDNIPNGKYLPQHERNAFDELVGATDFLCFSSDRMRKAGYIRDDRVIVPITDDAAKATYYIACLDRKKKEYSAFFSSVRESAMNDL